MVESYSVEKSWILWLDQILESLLIQNVHRFWPDFYVSLSFDNKTKMMRLGISCTFTYVTNPLWRHHTTKLLIDSHCITRNIMWMFILWRSCEPLLCRDISWNLKTNEISLPNYLFYYAKTHIIKSQLRKIVIYSELFWCEYRYKIYVEWST